MSRDWKPGDVAMVNGEVCIRTTKETWDHGDHLRFPRWGGAPARPLAVIDPEDRDQVERLLTILHGGTTGANAWLCGNADRLADALREFANPAQPKPEEPTGRFAEVEDAEGEHWFRLHAPDPLSRGGRVWAREGQLGTIRAWRAYADLDVVRVLDEGRPS